MTHDDFVREYAASIDRMMASRANRLDLSADFIPAWAFLTLMEVEDYADVEVGLPYEGAVGSSWAAVDASVRQAAQMRRETGLSHAARSRNGNRAIDRATYALAVQYGARDIGHVPPGWPPGASPVEWAERRRKRYKT